MSKKTPGPKEQNTRALRETNAAPAQAQIKAIRNQVKEAKEKAVRDAVREIIGPFQDELAKAKATRDAAEIEVTRLTRLIAQLTGDDAPATTPAKAGDKGTRERRGPVQLAEEAKAIVELVKGTGKDGILQGAIRKAFPKIPKGGNVGEYVAKHGGGKLRSEGELKSTRYFAD